MEKSDSVRKKALITGASRGIGRAIACELASAGYDLYLTCHKNIRQLEEVSRGLASKYEILCRCFAFPIYMEEKVLEMFDKELGGTGIATWTKPLGGYFISFDGMEGTAKKIVSMCKDAGIVMTGAGATYPYGKDPKDSNIRIAPSFPPMAELIEACKVFIICVKLVSIEKILETK